MRECIDAGFGERDRILVIEDMCRDLEALFVRFVDCRRRERDRKTRG